MQNPYDFLFPSCRSSIRKMSRLFAASCRASCLGALRRCYRRLLVLGFAGATAAWPRRVEIDPRNVSASVSSLCPGYLPPTLNPAQREEATRRRAQGATLQELAKSYDRSISTMRRVTRAG